MMSNQSDVKCDITTEADMDITYDDTNIDDAHNNMSNDETTAISNKSDSTDTELLIEDLNFQSRKHKKSPIKRHKLKRLNRVSIARKTSKELATESTKRVARALGVAEGDVMFPHEQNYPDLEIEDYADLINSLKKKFTEATSFSEKVYLLTLSPASWTITKIIQEFNVTRHQVKLARELKKKHCSILNYPPKRQGVSLPQSTVDTIIEFYQDDTFTRLSSGTKETVTVRLENCKIKKQKRYILMTLRDLYLEFKKNFPNIKVGFSKFVSLKPKWCFTITSHNAHNICVCHIHQIIKLMCDKLCRLVKLPSGEEAPSDVTYKEVFDNIVCSRDSKQCMVQRCYECQGKEKLKEYLQILLIHNECTLEDEVSFKQWVQGQGANLETKNMTIGDFIDFLTEAVDSATEHHYVAKSQANYLRNLKETLSCEEIICSLDYSENYGFPLQDSSQAYYFDKKQATLHPAVFYYRDPVTRKLACTSACVISDEKSHDAVTVHAFLRKLIPSFLENKPFVKILITSVMAQHLNTNTAGI
jgi:hypothetical protein